MKNTNSQKFRLGLFVIIGTVLFIIGVYLIGQRQNMFKKTFTISAYFQNVNGLQNGNNVRYSGIDIGTVRDIIMINDSTIKVDINIDECIKRIPIFYLGFKIFRYCVQFLHEILSSFILFI